MRILITNFWLHEFDESEVFCFKFIEHCRSQGHEVEIYAIDINASMRAYCAQNGIVLHEASSTFPSTKYDVLWMHHNVVPRDLLTPSKNKVLINRVISHHMSAFEPNDVPLFPSMESAIADRILASSYDVKIMLKEIGIDVDRVSVTGSPAPKEFIGENTPTAELNRFLFISNDPPKNVSAAIEMLETIGFEVKRVERKQFIDNRNWVSPSDLEWADAIISIEESIPYAVLAHRPIYLYNKYSGLGWVLDENELHASYLRNDGSSGESISLNVSAIVEQLLSEFEDARNYINNLDAESTRKFNFEKMLDDLLSELEVADEVTGDAFERITSANKVSWLAIQDVFIREVQGRRFADAAAKQALLERSIVVEKLAQIQNEVTEKQGAIVMVEAPVVFEDTQASQRKLSFTSRNLK